jgi:hypothetical protein
MQKKEKKKSKDKSMPNLPCVLVKSAWRLRYFRLEGGELVYYEKEPGEKWAADSATLKKAGRPGSVAEAEAAAAAQGQELSDGDRAKALAAEQDDEVFTDKNVKGAVNMAEIVDLQLSVKTAVAVSSAKLYYQTLAKQAGGSSSSSGAAAVGAAAKAFAEASTSEGKPKSGADLAENMVVFKVTTAKKRRYVLAVAYEQVVPVVAAFARHVAFARASLRFRREFGSGVPSLTLTLAERLAWAASHESAQAALAVLLVGYRSKFFKEKVLEYELYNLGGLSITPARIITAFIVTKTLNDVYVASKYADREKKYGIQWEVQDRVHLCCFSGLSIVFFRSKSLTRKQNYLHGIMAALCALCHSTKPTCWRVAYAPKSSTRSPSRACARSTRSTTAACAAASSATPVRPRCSSTT